MIKHERKQCPRCKKEFECKAGKIKLCQCSDVEINHEQLEYIKMHYEDCLCKKCLEAVCLELN